MDDEFPALEIPCPDCEARGYNHWPCGKPYTCDRCCGEGDAVTPFGEAVLDFVRRKLIR